VLSMPPAFALSQDQTLKLNQELETITIKKFLDLNAHSKHLSPIKNK
jgi:hypothetical protein